MPSPRKLAQRLTGLVLGTAVLFGPAAAPAAAASASASLYVLTAGNSVATVVAGAPATGAALPVGGLGDGESLVAIDVRPQNGRLYGLTSSAAGVRLYHIDTASGAAVATPLSEAPVQFDDGANPVPIVAESFGIDFNPTVDRLRVVTDSGLNFRMNPNNGALVDGDNGGAAGSAPGTNPDGAVKGAATGVDDTAYTNSFANAAVTTQYALDSATDRLYIQNPPNSGTQTMGLSLTLDGAPLDFSGAAGLDIPSGVAVAAANSPAAGTAYAALTVGGEAGLYAVDLTSGAARPFGALADGAIDIAVAVTPPAAVALSADGAQLLRIRLDQLAAPVAVPVSGVAAGETLVGIDGRPATGQLFGVGVDAAADTATVYRIDPQTGAATAVGAPGAVAFVDAAGDPVDLPEPSVGYGVDFNPTVDRIRFVNAAGLNSRLNQLTGAPVDGDLGGAAGSVAGTNPDGPIGGASSSVDATAYTNSFQGVAGMTRTTQYTLDAAGDRLLIQNPPNAGVQTMAMPVTVAGAPLDFTAAGGFDITPDVAVAAPNTPATGRGYAALTVGGVTRLYAIELSSGAAVPLGTIGAGSAGVSGLAVWSAPLRYGVFLPFLAR